MTVNLVKSEFCQARIVFFGHVVGQQEVQPISTKVQAIVQFSVPINKRELMRYLGMSGYCRKFCCNFSVIAEPLTMLLRKNEPFIWSSHCQQAFEKIKDPTCLLTCSHGT